MKRLVKILLSVLTLCFIIILCTSCGKSSSGNGGKGGGGGIFSPIVNYYDVNFHTNGGSSIETVSIKENDYLDYTPFTIRNNYAFDGWYLDETLTVAAVFPLKVENEVNLYAKWLKTREETSCKDAVIKFWANDDCAAIYDITPSGFNLDRLEELEYYCHIYVTYDVYYKKDYDVPFDIGYAGAPKFEAYILRPDGSGYGDDDIKATTSTKSREIDVNVRISDIKDKKLSLSFSTDNIQNKIYFKNINVIFCFEK